MRLVLCLLTSIAMSTSVAQTSSQDASNKSATDDHPSKATQATQTEIQQVEDDWLQAERSTNPTALERILANDFVNLTPTGIGPDKETLLENFLQHAGEAPPYSVRQEDMHIYILGDAAVAAFVKVYIAKENGNVTREDDTHVYTREGGIWKLRISRVSLHGAGNLGGS